MRDTRQHVGLVGVTSQEHKSRKKKKKNENKNNVYVTHLLNQLLSIIIIRVDWKHDPQQRHESFLLISINCADISKQ